MKPTSSRLEVVVCEFIPKNVVSVGVLQGLVPVERLNSDLE